MTKRCRASTKSSLSSKPSARRAGEHPCLLPRSAPQALSPRSPALPETRPPDPHPPPAAEQGAGRSTSPAAATGSCRRRYSRPSLLPRLPRPPTPCLRSSLPTPSPPQPPSPQDRLAGFESALLSKLAYFNDLDRLSALCGPRTSHGHPWTPTDPLPPDSPTPRTHPHPAAPRQPAETPHSVHAGNLNVHGEEFVAVLRRLDECLEFLKANPSFADGAVFTLKFRQLQSRALSAVRAAVQGELQKAGRALQRWVAQEGAASLAGGNEDVVLATMCAAPLSPPLSPPRARGQSLARGDLLPQAHARTHRRAAAPTLAHPRPPRVSEFKQAAAELRGILGEVEARQSRKEYAQLLRDCHGLLAEARVGVLMELVQARHRATAAHSAAGTRRRGRPQLPPPPSGPWPSVRDSLPSLTVHPAR